MDATRRVEAALKSQTVVFCCMPSGLGLDMLIKLKVTATAFFKGKFGPMDSGRPLHSVLGVQSTSTHKGTLLPSACHPGLGVASSSLMMVAKSAKYG